MSRLFRPWVWSLFGSLVVACCVALSGCSSEVTDEDLKKWTRNEAGFRRLGELMEDTGVADEVRVRAILEVVRGGQPGRVRGLMDTVRAPQPVATAASLALLEDLSAEEQRAGRAKDGLFALMRYLPEADQDKVRERLAAWAFSGLTDASSTEQIKRQVEHRILLAQIDELGRHGTTAAALLLSRGFAIDKNFGFLLSFEDPALDKLALESLIKLHSIPEVQVSYAHLERVSRIKSAEAVLYLLRVYDTVEDRDIAADAFNRAVELLREPEVIRAGDKLSSALQIYLQGKNPDDRWFAAGMLARLGGPDEVSVIVARLKDDAVYDTGARDALEAAVGFCESSLSQQPPADLAPLHQLATQGNRVQRATALLCLKVLANSASAATLQNLIADETDLADFLGTNATIGSLASNVLSGIEFLQSLTKRREAGSVDAAGYALRRNLALMLVDRSGPALGEEVERLATTGRPD